MQENDWLAFLYGCIGWSNERRNRRQLRMVSQSDSLPVVKQAAEPLQTVPQADPPPVMKPACEHEEVASPATVTRSGRIVKPPVRFQEFAT